MTIGRQLVGRHGDHRLVEEREPFARLTVLISMYPGRDREREEVSVAEPLAETYSLLGDRGRRGEVSSASCWKTPGSSR